MVIVLEIFINGVTEISIIVTKDICFIINAYIAILLVMLCMACQYGQDN